MTEEEMPIISCENCLAFGKHCPHKILKPYHPYVYSCKLTVQDLEKENAELKEKLSKIFNYLANDIPHELINDATNKIWKMI